MIDSKKDFVNNWAYAENVFTIDECKQIIELGNKFKKEKAFIVKESKESIIHTEYRKNNVSWIHNTKESEFIYNRLGQITNELNKNFFNFDLFGFTEPLQFTEYKKLNDGYKQHIDKFFNNVVRKLSLIVQLSDLNEYEGNDLIIKCGFDEIMNKKQGTVIAFPSYVLHEVTPLLKGQRYSLVAWVNGPQFK